MDHFKQGASYANLISRIVAKLNVKGALCISACISLHGFLSTNYSMDSHLMLVKRFTHIFLVLQSLLTCIFQALL